MSKKKRCVMAVMSILLMMVLVAEAFFAPERLGTWYDDRTIGKAEYADMVYEPYQIYYYDSFSEKIGIAGDYLAQGNAYLVQMEERGEKVSDAQVLDYVNEELSMMGELGLIPQKLVAKEIIARRMLELYAIVDTRTKQENYPSNIRYWWLQCTIADGMVMVAMDQEYHKLYGIRISMAGEAEQGMRIWTQGLRNLPNDELAKMWAEYWELDSVIAEKENSMESGDTGMWTKDDSGDADNLTIFCQLILSSGESLVPMIEMYLYEKKGCYVNCGISFFMAV